MVFQDAAVHHDFQSRLAGALSRGLVHDTLLHPDSAGTGTNGRFDDLGDVFGSPEDIDDVDVVRDILDGRVAALAQNLGFIRIDRYDAVSARFI